MKASRLFWVLVLCIIFSLNLNSQIEIDTEHKLGISSLPTSNVKVNLVNDDQPITFKINNDYTGSTNMYGFDLDMNSASNVKVYGYRNLFDLNSSQNIYGSYNEFESAGTGRLYGIYNYLKNFGVSDKYGVYNDVRQPSGNKRSYGVYNKLTLNNSGTSYGTYNQILGSGSGTKYGTYNLVTQDNDGFAYAIYNRVSQNGDKLAYGAYTRLEGSGDGAKYGINSIVVQDASIDKPIIGFFTDLTPGLGTATGLRVYIREGAKSERQGIDLQVLAQPSDGLDKTYGINSEISHDGTGSSVAGYNNIVNINGASDPDFTYGIHNVINPNGSSTNSTFGTKTEILDINNTNGVLYGSHINLNSDGDRYGIYVDVNGFDDGVEPDDPNNPNPNVTNVYAAYLEGDMFLSGATHTLSDVKFKEDIKDLKDMLPKVLNMKSKSYKIKKKEKGKKEFGFLAQELELIFPELVNDVKSPPKFVKQITDVQVINPETDEVETKQEVTYVEEAREEFKAVNYDGLIPILIQALQEQQEQIEALKEDIKELKKK